jgi:cation diffusion facilitator family transporter
VLADALTSVLAIAAILAGRYLGLWFLDPVMGIVGAIVIMRWSYDLCRRAGKQLLDVVPSPSVADTIRARLEAIDDTRVADLHLWEIGPKRRSCIVSLVTSQPRDLAFYRTAIMGAHDDLSHVTVEVQRCDHDRAA